MDKVIIGNKNIVGYEYHCPECGNMFEEYKLQNVLEEKDLRALKQGKEIIPMSVECPNCGNELMGPDGDIKPIYETRANINKKAEEQYIIKLSYEYIDVNGKKINKNEDADQVGGANTIEQARELYDQFMSELDSPLNENSFHTIVLSENGKIIDGFTYKEKIDYDKIPIKGVNAKANLNKKAKKYQTMTSAVVASLLSEYPNAEVFLARDPEGNGFGTIGRGSISVEDNGKKIIIWPYEEMDADEFSGTYDEKGDPY